MLRNITIIIVLYYSQIISQITTNPFSKGEVMENKIKIAAAQLTPHF